MFDGGSASSCPIVNVQPLQIYILYVLGNFRQNEVIKEDAR
jgi:hypothetical protein